MNPSISLRLDALRTCAALMVFIYHLSQLGYTGQPLPAEVGRIGVLIFFVMSGYVIAYVTEHKHRDFRHYMYARLARLLSVFLPALLLTALADGLGRQLSDAPYAIYPNVYEPQAWIRLPFFLTFMFENSLLSLRWFSNGPMWSIAYEFWYYVLFGCITYARGPLRGAFIFISLLFAGWKVLLLAPVWFSGVLLYLHRERVIAKIGRLHQTLLLFAITLLVVLPMPPLQTFAKPLVDLGSQLVGAGWHMFFLCDYLYALPVLLLVATLIVPPQRRAEFPVRRKLIHFAANGSFSVYLYHVPLVLLFKVSGIYDSQSILQSMIAGLVTLTCCYMLATLTEHRKGTWRRFIETAGASIISRQERTGPHV